MESNINKNLNDEQLDDLIRQSFHRQQTIDEINVSVMKQLRRTSRRRILLQWAKIVAFAFGLPLLLLLFGWLLWLTFSQYDAPQLSILNCHPTIYAILLLPVAAMLYVTWRAIEHFSPSDV